MTIKSDLLIPNPLVSVVIPSYNRGGTVSETIDAILNQKRDFELEIVIGDDCSTDNVRDILIRYQKEYPQNIVLLFHETNIGLGANWATCVKHCRGKYLANCDNDDYWHNPNKLQLQVEFLETHREYGVVHTDYRTLNRKTGKTKEFIVSNFTLEKPIQKTFYSGKFKVCNATMMYRKELIDNYVHLDDFIKYQFTLQDWTTWVILAKYTDFYCLPFSTATIGIETESITRPKDYEQVRRRFEKEKECSQYLSLLFPEDLHFDENAYNIYLYSILLNLAFIRVDYLKAKEYTGRLSILKAGKNSSRKEKIATNRILFYAFCVLKQLKNR